MDKFGLALITNDKGPSLSFMHRSVLVELHSEILQKNVYSEVPIVVLDRAKFMQGCSIMSFCVCISLYQCRYLCMCIARWCSL